MRAFLLRSDLPNLGSISRATAIAFDAVQTAVLNGNQTSLFVKGAPPVECAHMLPDELLRFFAARNAAQKAFEFEEQGNADEAVKYWCFVFGDFFAKDK